jgi:hypothetical protein
MRETSGRSSRVTSKLRAGFVALLAFCAIGMAASATGANAAAGDPFAVDFDYVGLNVDATLTELNTLVLDPTTEDSEGNVIGPLEVRGTYTSDTAFTLPKATGLNFPEAKLDIEGAEITGNLGLTQDATGTYNPATGAMTINPKISLTLGTPNVRDFPPELLDIVGGMLPPGDAPYPLACEFAPLDVSLSTAGTWPAPGNTFDNTTPPTEGAVSGAWRSKPAVKALEGGAICDLIGSLIGPVGGIWLANTESVITDMPDPTGPKPPEITCAESGKVGAYPNCTDPVVQVPCDPPQTGIKPNCQNPPTKSAEITKVAITPAKGKIKAGKSLKVKIKVTNTGNEASGPIKVTLKSNNKRVTLPKSIKVNVAAGATATKTVKVKAKKKAKGKATLTAKYGSKSGKSVLTVKKAKKKKKK